MRNRKVYDGQGEKEKSEKGKKKRKGKKKQIPRFAWDDMNELGSDNNREKAQGLKPRCRAGSWGTIKVVPSRIARVSHRVYRTNKAGMKASATLKKGGQDDMNDKWEEQGLL
jgi:hypothetical protein